MSSGKRKRDEMAPNAGRGRGRPPNTDTTNPIPCEGAQIFKKKSWDPPQRKHGMAWPRLKKIYALEHLDELPPNVPTHASINAPPSTIPSKKYCDVTGFEAQYKHPSSGLRYMDSVVYQWILDNLDTFEKQQEVLEIRGASTRIK